MKIDKKLYLLNYWNSGPSYNALTNAYLAELSAEGLSAPSNTSALNTFITSVGSTILGKCDRLFTTLVGASGQETVSLINPTATRMTYPNGMTVALNGWTADGATQHGLLGYNYLNSAVNYLQNSASLFSYVEAASTIGDIIIGSTGGNGNSLRNILTIQQRICQGTNNQNTSIDLSGTGFVGLSRLDGTNVSGYNDAVITNRTSISVANISSAASIHRLGAVYSNARISMIWVGGYLTEGEVTTLRTAYAAFRTTMGV